MKILKNKKGKLFLGTGVKILIAVIIGALLLSGLYLLARDNIFATAQEKVESMFDYSKNNELSVPERVWGDIDGDGVMDNTDYRILCQEVLGQSGNYEFEALDLNGDGQISLSDVTAFKKKAAELRAQGLY